MIVQKNFLGKLKDFGLNSYEAKIWTALLSRGVSTAGELSDIANVPRSRSYDVLESLEKKGFIVMKIGKPIKYIAVPPEEVLDRVKKNVKSEADQHVENLESLRGTSVLEELQLLHTKGVDLVDPTDLTGSIKGQSSIINQLDTMFKGAEESIMIMTTVDGINRKAEALKRAFKKAKARNVSIRIAAPITEKNLDAAKSLGEYAEVRSLQDVQARFCIVDEKEVLFMLLNDAETHPSYDVGVWINTPFFCRALLSLFELSWKQMKIVA